MDTVKNPIKAAPKRKTYLALIALSFFLFGLIAGGYLIKSGVQTGTHAQAENTQALSIGSIAPDFTLVSFSGESISLSQFQGKPAVLLFWGSWCLPCLESMQLLKTVGNDYPQVIVLGIHRSDREGKARAALVTQNLYINYTLLQDPNANTYTKYMFNDEMPVIYLLDKGGKVADRLSGPTSEQEIRSKIQNLVGQ